MLDLLEIRDWFAGGNGTTFGTGPLQTPNHDSQFQIPQHKARPVLVDEQDTTRLRLHCRRLENGTSAVLSWMDRAPINQEKVESTVYLMSFRFIISQMSNSSRQTVAKALITAHLVGCRSQNSPPSIKTKISYLPHYVPTATTTKPDFPRIAETPSKAASSPQPRRRRRDASHVNPSTGSWTHWFLVPLENYDNW